MVSLDTNGVKTTYAYAPDGLRHSKTVDGIKTSFVYDNANIIEEITPEGATRYYRGLEIIRNDKVVCYYYNGQGDVAFLKDRRGNVLADYTFDAYGNSLQENTYYNPFGYRGEYTDAESGWVYLRARMYDPAIGRFVNEDPVKYGWNWYTYADSNPVYYIDPSGNNPIAMAEAFLQSPVGQQMYQYLANLANHAGVTITNYVVQNFPQIQQAANYISQFGVTAWDWTTNTAVPWISEKAQQAGRAISDNAEKAGNWLKEKINNSTNGDPNKKPKNNSSGSGMNNKRVLDTTEIKGHKVTMDLEKGGSGLNNIHIEVDGTKYYYNEQVQAFTNSAGNRLPKSLRGNQDIINAFNKAKKLISQGW